MKKYKMAELVVLNEEQEFITDSLKVAQKFKKRPDNVLRDIRNLGCSKQFWLLNFEERKYTKRGKIEFYYEMTRDGFAFLAMGFTGKEADVWKEKYILLFRKLEKAYLRSIKNQKVPEWIKGREQGKVVRFEETEEVKALLAYIRLCNPESTYAKKPGLLYSLYTNMAYRALFNIKKGLKNKRNHMTKQQLTDLARAEGLIRQNIRQHLVGEMEYHAIYFEIKPRIKMYGEAIGKTDVPVCQQLSLGELL